jgi:hypothetical protein
VPTYALTDNEKTVSVDHVARIAVRNPEIVEVGRWTFTDRGAQFGHDAAGEWPDWPDCCLGTNLGRWGTVWPRRWWGAVLWPDWAGQLCCLSLIVTSRAGEAPAFVTWRAVWPR